jgi:non-ribosomal peptide synthetase component F
LFQVMIAWQTQEAASFALPSLAVESLPIVPTRAKFDLLLDLAPQSDSSIAGAIEYDASLFDETTIIRWMAYFIHMLEGMAAAAMPE